MEFPDWVQVKEKTPYPPQTKVKCFTRQKTKQTQVSNEIIRRYLIRKIIAAEGRSIILREKQVRQISPENS